MATQDLWGELSLDETVRTPVTILREQAVLLGQKTKNILQGRVNTQSSPFDNDFEARLEIIAPSLDNYSYNVLTVKYPVTLYPVTVTPDINTTPPELVLPPPIPIKCPDEVSFIRALGNVLSLPQVRKVISLLVAQSRENS